ncbi:MAG: hypothetical protein ABSG15_12955 [FCB group bacterium]|jgi:hypothetical protein
MKYLFFSLFVLIILLSINTQNSFAKNYKYKSAKVEFTLPEPWETDNDNDMFIAYIPKENDSLIFSLINATDLETAYKEAKSLLKNKFQNIQITEPQEADFNNMAGYNFDAETQIQGLTLIINADLIITPSSKILFFYGYGESELMKKYHITIDKIVKSIRPIK